MEHPTQPVWTNYTGGDSIWSVAVTGAAVYVQGHFQWLDNTEGVGDNVNPEAVERIGIGAIDSDGGKALSWNPGKPAKQGGKQLLATQDACGWSRTVGASTVSRGTGCVRTARFVAALTGRRAAVNVDGDAKASIPLQIA